MHTVWSVFACSAIQAGTLSRRQGGVCGAHSVCLSKVVLGLFFAVISSLNGNTSADETGIHKQLRYFETLKMSDFTVRSRKRRSAEDISPTQEISFQAFGRQFDLVLKEGSSVFAPDFHAKTVERNGRMERIQLSEEDFLTGHLREDESVAVDAFFEDGVLCSVIHSHDEIYVTEPSWRHIPHSGNHSVIAYRGSDIRWRVSFPPPPVLQDNTAHDSLASEGGKRERRASETWAKNRCPLRVVADHKFFSIHAFNRTVTAAQIMIWTIQMANRILTTTVWDKTGLTNIGIHIKEMLIFKEPTTGEAFSFNWPNRAPVRLDLLEDFSRMKHNRAFCVNHLFTAYVFKDHTVGFTYPACYLKHTGGICSQPVHQYTYHRGSEGTIYPNTGFTSSLGPAGEQLLHLMRTLVTVHGHSWGAPHDGATSHCSREQMTEKDGVSCQGEGDPAGQYLMHPQSVDGHHPNNMMFSPCSKYEISLALRAKAPSCFVDEGTHMWKCGNGIVDEGEMCDAGVRGRFDKKDPCCTSTCRLRDNATCSDFNSDCCLNCQTAPKGFQCAEEIDLICVKASFCDGLSLKCPPAESLPDGTPCLDSGACFDGDCRSYCHKLGRQQGKTLVDCFCENKEHACTRCCMEALNGTLGNCTATDQKVDEDRPCYMGYCSKEGLCIPADDSFGSRLWTWMQTADSHSFRDAIRSNVVHVIILMSLLIWVPLALVINCTDRKLPLKWRPPQVQLCCEAPLSIEEFPQAGREPAETPQHYAARGDVATTPASGASLASSASVARSAFSTASGDTSGLSDYKASGVSVATSGCAASDVSSTRSGYSAYAVRGTAPGYPGASPGVGATRRV